MSSSSNGKEKKKSSDIGRRGAFISFFFFFVFVRAPAGVEEVRGYGRCTTEDKRFSITSHGARRVKVNVCESFSRIFNFCGAQ